MGGERRLLTIGHSYVVAENRRLADAMAREGAGRWRVTVVAPQRFRADLGRIAAEPLADERAELVLAPVRFDRSPHGMWFGNMSGVLAQPWDVVHCWEEPFVLATDRIARRAPRAARFVVSTFQNIVKPYPWPLSAFERRVMQRADGWIAFGTSVRDALASRPAYAEKPVRVIPPGVDLARFRPSAEQCAAVRARLGWPPDAFVVGFLGRFVEEKGLRTLIAALSGLDGDWCALLVGGGPLEHEIASFATRFAGRVHVQTGIRHADVPEWLNAMSILCAPSVTTRRWREQFGRMLIEAMACGVPVVASTSGEMPHVVDGAGDIVAEGDEHAWRAAIATLREDPARRARLAAAGRARAIARYDWRAIAADHLDFFERLL